MDGELAMAVWSALIERCVSSTPLYLPHQEGLVLSTLTTLMVLMALTQLMVSRSVVSIINQGKAEVLALID
jgi:hypothetical protein